MSVLDNLPDYPVEVLVNNDTHDIIEVQHPCVSYYYDCHDDLSSTYKGLFDKATGEFVYFLEDDDYLLPHFFSTLDFAYDINFLNYKAADPIVEIQRVRAGFSVDKYHFQLGQVLFRKDKLTHFPTGNVLANDWALYQAITGTTTMVKKYTWIQTTDGKDNISFGAYSKDDRFVHQAI